MYLLLNFKIQSLNFANKSKTARDRSLRDLIGLLLWGIETRRGGVNIVGCSWEQNGGRGQAEGPGGSRLL